MRAKVKLPERARPSTIGDATLDQIIHISQAVNGGSCSHAEATLMLMCVPSLLEELRESRRILAELTWEGNEQISRDNVVHLPNGGLAQ